MMQWTSFCSVQIVGALSLSLSLSLSVQRETTAALIFAPSQSIPLSLQERIVYIVSPDHQKVRFWHPPNFVLSPLAEEGGGGAETSKTLLSPAD